ncbi:MAG TPA: alpha/beta hydrolase-fold protein, partial [Thermoleophilia bacterium]|nr:alpha/beta hydrolase-fold protein [Thermoleophilia bacterium]
GGAPQDPVSGPEAGMTRRQLLVGGGVVVAGLAVAGVVGWRSWTVRDSWYRLTGAYGEPGTPPPAYEVTYERGTLPSTHLSEPAAYDIAYPAGVAGGSNQGGAPYPVLICLPGRGRPPEALLEGGLRFGDFVADGIERRGVPPFAVAALQAGDTYWHARASGDDAMAVLFDEFIPFLRDQRGLTGPLAIMGWSMGGYGALRAAELHPQDFAAVCGVSAALWRSYEDGVGDAFDSAADYARNDVYADAGKLRGLPVRVDCGRQDPFYDADVAFTQALPESPAGGFEPGGHNDDYWSRVAPAEIDWIGAQFARR